MIPMLMYMMRYHEGSQGQNWGLTLSPTAFPPIVNSNIRELFIFKGLSLILNPSAPSCIKKILWKPRPLGWIKGSSDGMTVVLHILQLVGGFSETPRVSMQAVSLISLVKVISSLLSILALRWQWSLLQKKTIGLIFGSNSTICLQCKNFLIILQPIRS